MGRTSGGLKEVNFFQFFTANDEISDSVDVKKSPM